MRFFLPRRLGCSGSGSRMLRNCSSEVFHCSNFKFFSRPYFGNFLFHFAKKCVRIMFTQKIFNYYFLKYFSRRGFNTILGVKQTWKKE